MNTININLFGDILIHLGNDLGEDLFDDIPDNAPSDNTGNETDVGFEEEPDDADLDLEGLLISIEGMPEDINRENVESIVNEAAELLRKEMRKAALKRKNVKEGD